MVTESEDIERINHFVGIAKKLAPFTGAIALETETPHYLTSSIQVDKTIGSAMIHLFTVGEIHINLDKVVSWRFSKGKYVREGDALVVEFDHDLAKTFDTSGRTRWYYRKEYGDDIDIAYTKLIQLGNP